MGKRDHKRRRILIDRLQIQLLAIMLVYFLTAAVVLSLAMFAPLVLQLSVEKPSIEQAETATEFLSLHTRFWPALLLTFAALSVHSIFTSHRIVGPLYRFRVVFDQVAQGNLVPWVGLRRRDFLMKEAEALNEMVTSLRDRIHRLATTHDEAVRESNDIERALRTDSIREARAHLVELQGTLTRQQQELDAFRIEAK